MADLIPKSTPLPLSRPEILNYQPEPAFEEKGWVMKEVTELPDIFSHTEKVGTELMKEQWNQMKEGFNDFMNMIVEGGDYIIDKISDANASDIVYAVAGTALLSLFVVIVGLGLSKLVRKLFR